ncbi:PD-(D/E)XK nuclease family protein [Candidatus Omnitrophota bacterium]
MKAYDNTQIITFQSCPFKYYLKFIKGLKKQSVDETNIDILFGSQVHEFLEKYYLKEKINLDEHWSEFVDVAEQPAKSKAGGKHLCREYHKHYKGQDDNKEILDLESVSEFKVRGFEFRVKRDGAFKERDNIFGLEHKTTGDIRYGYWKQFDVHSQITAQVYDVRRIHNRCSGILINVLGVVYLKRKSKIRDAGLNCNFGREYVNRTQQELSTWEDNVEEWITRIEQAKDAGRWPKADGGLACSSYRGCSFKELCKVSSLEEIDEDIADVLYTVVDPYAYLNGRT